MKKKKIKKNKNYKKLSEPLIKFLSENLKIDKPSKKKLFFFENSKIFKLFI